MANGSSDPLQGKCGESWVCKRPTAALGPGDGQGATGSRNASLWSINLPVVLEPKMAFWSACQGSANLGDSTPAAEL